MNNMMKNVVIAAKGFAMGTANVIPGVSGGTIALLTGIFTELIEALNAIMSPASWKLLIRGKFKEFWKAIHGAFLCSLTIGVLVSIFSLAKLMTYLLRHHPVQAWAFFFGLIIVSGIYMLADIKGWKLRDVLFLVAGIALGVAICTLSPTQTTDAKWFIVVCGAIAICAMILPGISGSFILVVLGKYDYIMEAVSTLNLPVLIAFGIGCVLGILAFSKFLHWLLDRYKRPTLLTLIGFTLGSLVKVWPWNDPAALAEANALNSTPGAMHIPGAILWAVAGVLLVVLLETLPRKKKI
jgi:putative membrane protein